MHELVVIETGHINARFKHEVKKKTHRMFAHLKNLLSYYDISRHNATHCVTVHKVLSVVRLPDDGCQQPKHVVVD